MSMRDYKREAKMNRAIYSSSVATAQARVVSKSGENIEDDEERVQAPGEMTGFE
jgi:hypothetical protein